MNEHLVLKLNLKPEWKFSFSHKVENRTILLCWFWPWNNTVATFLSDLGGFYKISIFCVHFGHENLRSHLRWI